MSEFVKKSIFDLIPYSLNQDIYGKNENISWLVDEIRNRGIVTTLVITKNNVIVSGHSRWRACKQLFSEGDKRFEYVNCEVVDLINETDITERLVVENLQREKTTWQKSNEVAKLMEIEKERAAIRRKATQNNNAAKYADVSKSTPQRKVGKSRDIVAEKTNLKPMEVDRLTQINKFIKDLKLHRREEDANLLINITNHNPSSTTIEFIKYFDVMTDNDKNEANNAVLTGKSVHSIVNKFRTTKVNKKECNNVLSDPKKSYILQSNESINN